MKSRILGRTGISVSEVGLGCEHLQDMEYKDVHSVINTAIDEGITFFDCFMSEPGVRSNIGKAIGNRRQTIALQGHIGSAWIDGQYLRTRDLNTCKHFFEDFRIRYNTDYVDVGMIHFVDEIEDYDKVLQEKILDYALELKQKGIIKAIGLSSHNPVTAMKAIQGGMIDVLMFSINAAYDLLPEDTELDNLFIPDTYTGTFEGFNQIRSRLYQSCEAGGTAITVMKPLAAGTLLNAKSSPFGAAMTPAQCIHYALSRPAVSSVLVGCRTPEEVHTAARYASMSDEERDYSSILSNTPKFSMAGKCMYCNHCHPCPAGIDIAQVNKYLDLAEATDTIPATVKEHYLALKNRAKDCLHCGDCEARCPFQVKVGERMELAKRYFEA